MDDLAAALKADQRLNEVIQEANRQVEIRRNLFAALDEILDGSTLKIKDIRAKVVNLRKNVSEYYPMFIPTHQHLKTGNMYRLLRYGRFEKDRSRVAIYEGIEGTVWAQDLEEFEDGRFVQLNRA